MLPQMPVKPRRPFGEKSLRLRQDVRCDVRPPVDVDPKRDFADAPRIGRDVFYGPLCRPFLPERKITVAARRRPPIALQRRKHDRMARSVGTKFRRRLEADVLLAFNDKTFDSRLRVFRSDVKPVLADEKRADHRRVSEIVAADGLRPGGPLFEKPCAVVGVRQHRVALAIARHAVETREIGRKELPVPRTVVEDETPRLRSVGAFFNHDPRIQNAALSTERHVAPDENLLARARTRSAEKRGFMRGHLYAIRQISVLGELCRPQIAAAGREFRRADANRAHRVLVVERRVHGTARRECECRQRQRQNHPIHNPESLKSQTCISPPSRLRGGRPRRDCAFPARRDCRGRNLFARTPPGRLCGRATCRLLRAS